jgi:hypothetical protein
MAEIIAIITIYNIPLLIYNKDIKEEDNNYFGL